jgi:lysophospholipase L1-like esterase
VRLPGVLTGPGAVRPIDSLNGRIKEYEAQQGLVVVDYHAVLVASDGNHYRPGLTIDGVHLTPAGYDFMGPLLEDAIAADQKK